MVTRAAVINQITELVKALVQEGYEPSNVYLFGSMVTGKQHAYSDIDLAIWDERFTSCLTIDYEPIKHILTRFPLIELHTFSSSDTKESNPWAREIMEQGVSFDVQELLAEEVN